MPITNVLKGMWRKPEAAGTLMWAVLSVGSSIYVNNYNEFS